MDGLLLDTEKLWGISMNRVADRYGIPITPDRFKETTGLRIHEVTEHWSRIFPWGGSDHAQVAEDILDDIIALSREQAGIMQGVLPLMDLLKRMDMKVGLATSSPIRMVHALLDHFNLNQYFDEVSSADSVQFGKPHPGVFLYCAEKLGSPAHQCLVLEDSVNGAIAGKAARMKVVAVPDDIHYEDPRFSIADLKLRSLELLDEAQIMQL